MRNTLKMQLVCMYVYMYMYVGNYTQYVYGICIACINHRPAAFFSSAAASGR